MPGYEKLEYILLIIESRWMIILHGPVTDTICMPKLGGLAKINKSA